jgi:hypothetical protein
MDVERKRRYWHSLPYQLSSLVYTEPWNRQ